MDRIFVVESCEIDGSESDPATPSKVTPLLMFDAMILLCSVLDMETVPPVVYPAGMETVPALVEIVPDVLPLLDIPPETEPEAPNAVFPVSTCSLVMSALDVS